MVVQQYGGRVFVEKIHAEDNLILYTLKFIQEIDELFLKINLFEGEEFEGEECAEKFVEMFAG